MKTKILIVDDDSLVVEFLKEALDVEKYEMHSSHSAESALARLRSESFELILSDIRMGEMDGMELLTHIRELSPKTIVIMMTGFGSIETAVLAMKLGAFDFIMKPMSPESVEVRVKKAVEHIKLNRQVVALKLDSARRYSGIVGSSKLMTDIFDRIRLAAPSRATVLVGGESGSGKELIARAIHEESDRADGPFVKLNCAALNQNLIESELFGHEKGAFTGAIQARSGRFELANGGTLLLDEISEMPYETQSKLLRTLQEREIERVGSAETVVIDVRIIASSNRDLAGAIADGSFREDLFYRLNVISIDVPPLRDRTDDIPQLVEYFVKKYSEENNRAIKSVDREVFEVFKKYPWPGNVRELENAVQAAVVMSAGKTISTADFSLDASAIRKPLANKIEFESLTLHELERQLILDRLQRFGGSKSEAARSLDVSARTIRNKLKEYSEFGDAERTNGNGSSAEE
jgi:two-component system, NtrC family, response regulator AtoC